MRENNMRLRDSWLPAALIVMIGVCYAIITSTLGLLGDDLAFFSRTEPYAGSKFYLFPKHMLATWLWSNGRLQNVICPAMFQYAPGPLLWILNGAMTALLFWMTLRWSGARTVFAKVALIAVMAFMLPWWDMFLLVDVNIGYAWGMALALVSLWFFFEHRPLPNGFWGKFGLAALACVTAGMHEALGLPMCASVAIYLCFDGRFRRLAPAQKWMAWGAALGLLYCIASPGIWMRIQGEKITDGQWWWLLCRSSPLVLLLIGVTVVTLIWRRDALKRLLSTPWSVMALMALMSMPIVVMGGIVGRSGFFGQVPALIALCWLLREMFPGFRLRPALEWPLAVILAAAVAFHYVEFTRWQMRLNDEVKEAVEAYKDSPDGAVYMDFTNEPDMPWYLLRKTCGVPDEDDFYLSTTMTKYIGSPDRPFTVLPAALKGMEADSISGDVAVGKGYVTLRTPGREMPRSGGRRVISSPGRPDSVAVPVNGTKAWYVVERDYDPSGSY